MTTLSEIGILFISFLPLWPLALQPQSKLSDYVCEFRDQAEIQLVRAEPDILTSHSHRPLVLRRSVCDNWLRVRLLVRHHVRRLLARIACICEGLLALSWWLHQLL